ncbi:hypothetical protein B296_00001107 [Ensete ventricosum]|uniref:Uncharacterized protein n=1 Tax=Ensete ventricosum TaxID=4639 RepID=A0A427AU45_ENSVE|nr:hypothetical protein B296_00001107 [Ensete ventricosum]
MERHNPTLASIRVHVLDLNLRKASCLRSIILHLLCRLPSRDLDTSPNPSQVAPPPDLH